MTTRSSRHHVFHYGQMRTLPPVAENPEVMLVAHRYNSEHGLPMPRNVRASLSPAEGRALANAYEHAQDASGSTHMRAAYSAFNREVAQQHTALLAAGYRIEPWTKPGQPYRNSAEMMEDVRRHKHLWYFRSTEGTVPHALLTHAENDKFRAVHDVFGHAKGGNQFGPNGETSAFASHVQMFTPEARPAVVAETLGQNAWFNYGPNADKPVNQRPFATQKAAHINPALYEPIIERSEGAERRRQARRSALRVRWIGRPR